MLRNGRPKCAGLVQSIVSGKHGLEIGGPSAVFRRWFNLPVYDLIGNLDNCDFTKETTWASHPDTYAFSRRRPAGRVYFGEGSDLKAIPAAKYDFILSSHNLEHFANPVKGLKEWQRVAKPGGHLVLVLPHYAKTFDWRRTPATVEHMLADYEAGTGEDDLTHVEETFQAHRLNEPSRSDEELRKLLLNNYNHRMMHHHVFDEANSRALLEAVGLRVQAVETQPPFHIYLVARFPD